MVIDIKQNTKFNINDKVYYIEYVPKYNDLYHNEMLWKVGSDYDGRNPIIHKIKKIRIEKEYYENNEEKLSIFYLLDDNRWYEETLLFTTVEEAKQACIKRNEEDY